jgi:hypothetical protein
MPVHAYDSQKGPPKLELDMTTSQLSERVRKNREEEENLRVTNRGFRPVSRK